MFFEESVRLDEARAPRAELRGCHVPALSARQFETRGDLTLDRLTCAQLVLAGARVGGVLALRDARLEDGQGVVLDADQLDVHIRLDCSRLQATGELRLQGAHIGGELNFGGARLGNGGAPALNAGGLQVDRSMYCHAVDGQRFEATGELRLQGAHIGGELNFAGAELRNSQGSLALDLESVDALGLRLPGDHADGRPPAPPPVGIVNLTDALVGQFHDGWRAAQADGSSHQYHLRLSGFVYQSLGSSNDDCDARLDWVRHADEGYVPQAYEQLEAAFRRAGREEDAQRVAIDKQRCRRRTLPRPARAASIFLDYAVGYGYRTWRAAVALLVIILIGSCVFAASFPEHLRAERPAAQLPPFHALLYSLDAVLPVVNLGQKSARTPTGVAQVWYAFSVLAGWLLSLGFVAYFTAKLFRE